MADGNKVLNPLTFTAQQLVKLHITQPTEMLGGRFVETGAESSEPNHPVFH